ncbi:hypothetical protein DXG03_002262, partial [Asterophora parasitica]
MVVVTPGVDFIALSLVKIVTPSVIFAFSVRTLSNTYGYPISTWILVSSSIIFVPLLSITRVVYKSFDDKRKAAALGARLAPTMDGKSIGNIDLLSALKRHWDTGYPADGLIEVFSEKGPVINMRVLWSDMIFTSCPEHIKTILATDFNNYVKGKQLMSVYIVFTESHLDIDTGKRLQNTMFTVLGSGVFNVD